MPSPSASGPMQSGPGAGPSPGVPAGGGGSEGMAAFARIAMQANQAAEQFPQAAQEMRQIQNLVRQATMKVIQANSAPPQATPQI